MGTRASIIFTDEFDDKYFVYRGHDAFPDTVLPDLQKAIDQSARRWDGSEMGALVTLFLAMMYDSDKTRLPDYELTTSVHGDESYHYCVEYVDGQWKASCVR